jgi:hypothetical protein
VRMFIGVSAHTCMSICVCTVFLKKRILDMEVKHVLYFSKKKRILDIEVKHLPMLAYLFDIKSGSPNSTTSDGNKG